MFSITAVSDTALPETALPETALPETALPDTAVSETALPDTAVSETALPDTAVSDTALAAVDAYITEVERIGVEAAAAYMAESKRVQDAEEHIVSMFVEAEANITRHHEVRSYPTSLNLPHFPRHVPQAAINTEFGNLFDKARANGAAYSIARLYAEAKDKVVNPNIRALKTSFTEYNLQERDCQLQNCIRKVASGRVQCVTAYQVQRVSEYSFDFLEHRSK